jgi:hypothetical protein
MGDPERGHNSEHEDGDQAAEEGHENQRRVQSRHAEGLKLGRGDGEQRTTADVAETQAQNPTDASQDRCLCQQLHDNLSSAGTDGEPGRYLTLTAFSTEQQQAGGVGAGNQQEATDSCLKQEQYEPGIAQSLGPKSAQDRRKRTDLGILQPHLICDGGEPRRRCVNGRLGLQSADDACPESSARASDARIHDQRRPDSDGFVWEVE